MAYAQLVFSNSATAGQVMKALARVLCGERNLSSLDGVVTTAQPDPQRLGLGAYVSEIVNASSEAWQLAYPAVLPGTGLFNINTFTIRSPCITASKFKFVRFALTNSSGAFTEPINSGSSTHSLVSPYCIYVQGLSAVDSTTGATTNLTWRNSNGTFATFQRGSTLPAPPVIWLSWSARHLFILSNLGGGTNPGRTCWHATFEFDETGPTTFSTSAPCIHMTGGADLTWSALSTPTAVAEAVNSLLSTFDPTTGVIVGNRQLTNKVGSSSRLSSSITMGATDAGEINALATVTAGRKSWSAAPLTINDTDRGNGLIDLTKHSDVWLFLNGSYEGATWSLQTGAQYKSLNVYNATGTAFSTILVKYG